MIEIRNITITPRGDKMIIDANISRNSVFDNCYIKKVYIDTQDTYDMTGPSEDIVFEKSISKDDASDLKDSTTMIGEDEKVRKMHLVIHEEEICACLKSNLFVIYIQADGAFDKSQISKCDSNTIVVGCVFWMKPMYQDFLGFVRELNEKCEVPRNFIYLYLQYQALLVAVRTGNMMEAIMIYKKFIRKPIPKEHHHDHKPVVDCHDHHHHDHHHHRHDDDDEHDEHHHDHHGIHDQNFIHSGHHNCNCHGGNHTPRY